jgi:hypothetical protein
VFDVAEGGERVKQALDVAPAGAVEVAGDLLDGERPVGVVHDGVDGLRAVFEGGRPGERLGRGAVAAHVEVEVQRGLRLHLLGRLVRRARTFDARCH